MAHFAAFQFAGSEGAQFFFYASDVEVVETASAQRSDLLLLIRRKQAASSFWFSWPQPLPPRGAIGSRETTWSRGCLHSKSLPRGAHMPQHVPDIAQECLGAYGAPSWYYEREHGRVSQSPEPAKVEPAMPDCVRRTLAAQRTMTLRCYQPVTSACRYKPPPKRKGRTLAEITESLARRCQVIRLFPESLCIPLAAFDLAKVPPIDLQCAREAWNGINDRVHHVGPQNRHVACAEGLYSKRLNGSRSAIAGRQAAPEDVVLVLGLHLRRQSLLKCGGRACGKLFPAATRGAGP